MSIDLRSVTGKPIDPATGRASTLRKGSRQKDGGQSIQSDSLALTDVAARLKQAEEAMAAGNVIDTELVARVVDSLQAGTYEIDAEHIAEKIIEMESGLPQLESVGEAE